MDVLTDVLNTVRVTAACYGRVELGAPWGFSVSSAEGPMFHVVLDGECWLSVDGIDKPVSLSTGDLFMLPHGHAHVLRDRPSTEARPLEQLLPRVPVGCTESVQARPTNGGNGSPRYGNGSSSSNGHSAAAHAPSSNGAGGNGAGGNGARANGANGHGANGHGANGHGANGQGAHTNGAGAGPCGANVLRIGGEGPKTNMVCGFLRFQDPRNNPVLRALPPLVLIRGDDGRAVHWLEHTLRFIACESASGRPGAETIVNRLADVLFIQIVRGYLANIPNESRGWMRALSDPQIGASLGLIHENPQQGWTVATLASSVGMSRSTFAGRFSELVGEPPLHYVTRWRMQRAASLLREGQATLADIAERVGYESEAAFSKAFKRWVGTAPGAYRRAHAHVEASA